MDVFQLAGLISINFSRMCFQNRETRIKLGAQQLHNQLINHYYFIETDAG